MNNNVHQGTDFIIDPLKLMPPFIITNRRDLLVVLGCNHDRKQGECDCCFSLSNFMMIGLEKGVVWFTCELSCASVVS